MRLTASLAALALLAGTIAAGDAGLAGSWKLTILEDGQLATLWLVRFDNKAGKWSGAAEGMKGIPATTIEDVKVGELIHFDVKLGNRVTFQFEGKAPRAGAKKILGSFTRDGRSTPAFLEATIAKNAFELDREVVMRTPNDPKVFGIVLELIAAGKEHKVPAKDVQEWIDTALRSAEAYGPRLQSDTMMKLIDALAAQKEYAALSGNIALKAQTMLDPKASPLTQIRFLTPLQNALQKSGLTEQIGAIDARIDKLEQPAYIEYAKDGFGYTPKKSAGRKGKGDRAVLVELFTGAMCPPCVAADLGFDGLEKTYSPKEVVLLQYHLHIPGPDALCSADVEKRSEFYSRSLRGTPAIYLNGKADKNVQGGGGREDAEDKYKEYREAIDVLLDKPAGAALQVSAVRDGDKIQIKASATGIEKPAETMRLRLALVEDWVRYKARNGTLYHHRVVRALPGGPAGLALTKKDAEQSVTVDLGDIRKGLHKYLDDYIKNESPFPDAQRPMRFKDLHVVAFVQNDETAEVLQAVDVAVRE